VKIIDTKLLLFSIISVSLVRPIFSVKDEDSADTNSIGSLVSEDHSSIFKRIEELKNENQNDGRTPTPEQKEKNPDSPIPENLSTTPSIENVRTITPTLETLKSVLEEHKVQAEQAKAMAKQKENEAKMAKLKAEQEEREVEALSKALTNLRNKEAIKREKQTLKEQPYNLSVLLEKAESILESARKLEANLDEEKKGENRAKVKSEYEALRRNLSEAEKSILDLKKVAIESGFPEFSKFLKNGIEKSLNPKQVIDYFLANKANPRTSNNPYSPTIPRIHAAQLLMAHYELGMDYSGKEEKGGALNEQAKTHKRLGETKDAKRLERQTLNMEVPIITAKYEYFTSRKLLKDITNYNYKHPAPKGTKNSRSKKSSVIFAPPKSFFEIEEFTEALKTEIKFLSNNFCSKDNNSPALFSTGHPSITPLLFEVKRSYLFTGGELSYYDQILKIMGNIKVLIWPRGADINIEKDEFKNIKTRVQTIPKWHQRELQPPSFNKN
jgi:hypothetical protein